MIEEGKVRRREINKQMAYILVEQGNTSAPDKQNNH